MNPLEKIGKKLLQDVEDMFADESVLLLASVDFSHYLAEEWAWIHDRVTYTHLLQYGDFETFMEADVDCPSCLSFISQIAEERGEFPHLWLRDAAAVYNPSAP